MPTLPETKLQSSVPLEYTDNVQHYINSIVDTGASKIMIVLSGGSAHQIPDSTGSGVIIKKQGSNCSPTKIAEAVKCMGSSYHRELEAVATDYARDNLSPSIPPYIFCQSAILNIMSCNRGNSIKGALGVILRCLP